MNSTSPLLRAFWILLLAGLVPALAAKLSFLINMSQGMEGCFPYWDGCLSVSKGIRSGPGLWWFKGLALPGALLMWLAWQTLDRYPGLRLPIMLGKAGAVFFLVYALWLGTDGEIYRWLRRYGVVFYFGLTGLAHLVTLSRWPRQPGRGRAAVGVYAGVVMLTWALGVASAFKRKLIDDADFLDRVENALEWDFALSLSLCFVALAFLFRSDTGPGARSTTPGV